MKDRIKAKQDSLISKKEIKKREKQDKMWDLVEFEGYKRLTEM